MKHNFLIHIPLIYMDIFFVLKIYLEIICTEHLYAFITFNLSLTLSSDNISSSILHKNRVLTPELDLCRWR